MKISVRAAQTLAAELSHAAANAQQSGSPDVELTGALSALDDDARNQLAAAIAQAEEP